MTKDNIINKMHSSGIKNAKKVLMINGINLK